MINTTPQQLIDELVNAKDNRACQLQVDVIKPEATDEEMIKYAPRFAQMVMQSPSLILLNRYPLILSSLSTVLISQAFLLVCRW